MENHGDLDLESSLEKFKTYLMMCQCTDENLVDRFIETRSLVDFYRRSGGRFNGNSTGEASVCQSICFAFMGNANNHLISTVQNAEAASKTPLSGNSTGKAADAEGLSSAEVAIAQNADVTPKAPAGNFTGEAVDGNGTASAPNAEVAVAQNAEVAVKAPAGNSTDEASEGASAA